MGWLRAGSTPFSAAILAYAGLAGLALWRGAITDAAKPKADPRSGSTTTAVAARPTHGPVLVVTTTRTANPFCDYLAELLRADGWPGVAVVHSDAVRASTLDAVHVVVLCEGALPGSPVTVLGGWVTGGGVLLVMRPGDSLAPLTGVRVKGALGGPRAIEVPVPGDLSGSETHEVQVHGEVDRFDPRPGTEVRGWTRLPGAQGRVPAVTVRRLGHGAVIAWAFDLARSVALMRQGNPVFADTERDGLAGIRAVDALAGFVDLDRIEAPGVDLLMRFCRALVRGMAAPLDMPRLWQLPLPASSVLVVTSDAHGSTAGAVEAGLAVAEQRGGHVSLYYMPRARSGGMMRRAAADVWRTMNAWAGTGGDTAQRTPTAQDVARWRARGHEFAVHPDHEAGSPSDGLQRAVAAFADAGLADVAGSVRAHRVAWRGWVESVRAQRASGFRMNLDAYQVGPTLRRADGTWAHGFLFGSGLPARFVDGTGSLLDIYQLPTELVDEQLLAGAYDGFEALDVSRAKVVATALVEAAARWHTPVTLQFHTDFLETGHPLRASVLDWVGHVVDQAVARRMAVLSAAELLRHATCLEGAVFERWERQPGSGTTEIRVRVPEGCQVGLAVPLGRRATDAPPDVLVDGATPRSMTDLGGERIVALTAGVQDVRIHRGPVASDWQHPIPPEQFP